MGSSSKKHKVKILFTIGNSHPKFRSALKCIFVFAVAKTDDINKCDHGKTNHIAHKIIFERRRPLPSMALGLLLEKKICSL